MANGVKCNYTEDGKDLAVNFCGDFVIVMQSVIYVSDSDDDLPYSPHLPSPWLHHSEALWKNLPTFNKQQPPVPIATHEDRKELAMNFCGDSVITLCCSFVFGFSTIFSSNLFSHNYSNSP